MHQKHVENLKPQSEDYNVDPFEDSSAIYLASELGNEKYLNFGNERLIEGFIIQGYIKAKY